MIVIEQARAPTDEVCSLVAELEAILAVEYPPEQRHGLSVAELFQPHIRFFLARLDGEAVGCGGMALFDDFAEVKRMYARPAVRGRGVARALLARIEVETCEAGLRVLRLETGTRQLAALHLYERAGFERCERFGDYSSLPAGAVATSVFMEKLLHDI